MTIVRLGAVEYLNARPLVHGLKDAGFAVRFDVPSTCATLLHSGRIDVGLIPSIEYLRGSVPYSVVPGIAIACHGVGMGRRLHGGVLLRGSTSAPQLPS